MPNPVLKSCWLLFGWLAASTAHAVSYPLPPPDVDVIGEVQVVYAEHEDTLLDIARRHSLGYNEMVQANPGVDRWTPGKGTPIVLPTRYILPDAPRQGLVLNVAEMRLYYYPPPKAGEPAVVHTYPVSVGRMDWKTPLGTAKVVSKEANPVWRPPASIKAEHAAEGDILPDVVPSGPDNPLGLYAMRLSIPGYLIHGTDKPNGIGMRVTHGCLRLYPEDIERLYGMVPVGTSIQIMDAPVKVGRVNGQWLIEAHAPLEEEEIPITVTLDQAHKVISAKTGPEMAGIDLTAVDLVIEQFSGIPVAISGGDSMRNASAAYQRPAPYSVPRPTAAMGAAPPPVNAGLSAPPRSSAPTVTTPTAPPRPVAVPRAAAAQSAPALRAFTAYDLPRTPTAASSGAIYANDPSQSLPAPDDYTPRPYAPVARPIYQRPTANSTMREPPPVRAPGQP